MTRGSAERSCHCGRAGCIHGVRYRDPSTGVLRFVSFDEPAYSASLAVPGARCAILHVDGRVEIVRFGDA